MLAACTYVEPNNTMTTKYRQLFSRWSTQVVVCNDLKLYIELSYHVCIALYFYLFIEIEHTTMQRTCDFVHYFSIIKLKNILSLYLIIKIFKFLWHQIN